MNYFLVFTVFQSKRHFRYPNLNEETDAPGGTQVHRPSKTQHWDLIPNHSDS